MVTVARAAAAWPGWAVAAIGCGLVVGWFDLSATEVQGPLLLLMVSVFLLTLLGGRPPWLIAAAVALGLPAAHIIASVSGTGEGPAWSMLIVLVPSLFAAYAGLAVSWLLRAGADAIRPESGARLHTFSLLTLVVAGCAGAGAIPVWATLNARGQPIAWWVALWWQMTTLVGWAALAPVLLRWRKTPGTFESAGLTPAGLARHVGIVATLAAVHAAALPLLTVLLLVPLGPASLDRAALWAFAAYLPMDALTYVLVVTLAWASDRNRLAHATAERSAALSADLVRAQLDALRAQIQPHFLFNALNAVTMLARRDNAAAAAQATERLAELLRHVLKARLEDTVPLEEELAFIEKYLELERLRFGNRLEFSVEMDALARDALVPTLILQPLVENAVRHGIARRQGGHISIRGRTETGGRDLLVTVANRSHGPSTADDDDAATGSSSGVGLLSVRERLLVMYGATAVVALKTDGPHGAIASLKLPLRRAPTAQPTASAG